MSNRSDFEGVCSVCGKNIFYSLHLCGECIKEYGRVRANWPEWVREIVRFDDKLRYRDLIFFRKEKCATDLHLNNDLERDYEFSTAD